MSSSWDRVENVGSTEIASSGRNSNILLSDGAKSVSIRRISFNNMRDSERFVNGGATSKLSDVSNHRVRAVENRLGMSKGRSSVG